MELHSNICKDFLLWLVQPYARWKEPKKKNLPPQFGPIP